MQVDATFAPADLPHRPGTPGSGRSAKTCSSCWLVRYGSSFQQLKWNVRPFGVVKATLSPHCTSHHRSINQYIGARSMFSFSSFFSRRACGIPLGPTHVRHGALLPSASCSGSAHPLLCADGSTCFNQTLAQLSRPQAPSGKTPGSSRFAAAATAALAFAAALALGCGAPAPGSAGCWLEGLPLPSPFFPFPLPPLPLPFSSFLCRYSAQAFSLSGSSCPPGARQSLHWCPSLPHTTHLCVGLPSLSCVGKPGCWYQQEIPLVQKPLSFQDEHTGAQVEVEELYFWPFTVMPAAVGPPAEAGCCICDRGSGAAAADAAPVALPPAAAVAADSLAVAALLLSASFSPLARALCVSVRGREVLALVFPVTTMAPNSASANWLMARSPS